MNKTWPLWILAILLTFSSCKNKTTNTEPLSTSETENTQYNAQNHPGKKLLETQCFVCHNPTTPEGERIAPPMIAIKTHYIDENTTKEAFIKSLWHFVEKPTENKALMFGAVRRFGVMPYQPFKKEDIEKIGEYIYDYKIEEPEWFKEHFEAEGRGMGRMKSYNNEGKQTSSNTTKTKEDIGLEMAIETKKVLGKNLMGTIQKKGTLEALKFCNEKAYPLTDSMANHYNATIKRVSDKPRNPANQANATELEKIEFFKQQIAQNKNADPIVETDGETNHFYYPITTNTMCLQCHGTPETDIKPETLISIKTLYPNDKAKGYDINQVRGIWSITFNEQ